ncbi:beta-lactamase family protein [Streptomyces sp. R302]|uniref:serine hydrolase domain-containing protein n=1 Tax=unclassified Streptomyces TaxID=2593676 RepID=UPI00145D0DA5|nr:MULTISPECIES: serine hydrolase domain-containing protein [unclassified Streptomyces]NML52612.1 beta-lactamase family protein [Streptomyces sp. R301]NML80459.1 beta-lactamase family protein [Streptomyces sp. R302]
MTEQNTAAAQDRPELRKAMQEIVDAGFAGVQLRVNDELGEWVGSAGVSELGRTAKPPTDGHFRVGSVTKTFVATVVLQLVDEGRLGLQDPVADHLPELGLDRRITVRMLLQHTSGIFNFTGEFSADGTVEPGVVAGFGKEWVDLRHATFRPEELVRGALAKPARFEPGTAWSYSNTNYVLARLLIEKATGRSLPEVTHRLVLGPLGLTGTVLPEAREEIPEPHAHGYFGYDDAGRWKVVDTTRFNPSWASASGDMISTSRDLHTFFSALNGGKLISTELLAEMRVPDPTMGYGLGVFVEELEGGGTVLHHNGGFWGWGALMYSTPDGTRTLTGSLTSGDVEMDLPTMAGTFEKAKQTLVKAVFA